ncbi:hypothetical protein C1H71_20555 (plasmid) [Iodobacter fluviatilis]|uniref:Uncharacterized protein n=2 Tax=Iodobacter fluviatilis TaxID=537 RepID=A0A7G3GFM5_9NEIS|nr:hypothetical protein C1H71_20555 [Iodobacter fluviatilis]
MIFDQTIHQQEDKIVAIKESGGVSLTIGENDKDKLLVKSATTFEKDLTIGSVATDGSELGSLLVKNDATFKKGLSADSVTINGIGQGALLVKGGATFEKDLSIGSVATDGSEQGKLLVQNNATFKKGLSADSVTINGIGQGALLVKGGATFEKDLSIGSVAADGSEQGKLLVKNDATFKKGLTASSITIGDNTSGNLLVKSDATFERNLISKTLTIGNGTTIGQVINTRLGSTEEANSTLATVQAIREYVTDNAVGLTQYDNAEAVVTANLPINDGANGYKGIPGKDASVDNVKLTEGNLVLLTNQANKTHNCLWKISVGLWDKQENPQTGSAVFIKQGDINGGTLWIMKSTDIANPQWVRRADLDYLKAGAGLNKEGQTLSLKKPENSGLICDEKGVAIHLKKGVGDKNISGLICDNSGLALNIQQLFVFLDEASDTPDNIQKKIKEHLTAGAILVGTYKVS